MVSGTALGLSLPYIAAGFAAGAIIGSFLGVLFLRLPNAQDVVAGRSRCDACGKTLAAIELVPLVSFLWLRGRCRTCSAPIDRWLWGIELLAGLIGGIAVVVADDPRGLIWAGFGWTLLLLAALDIRHYWLPDRLTAVLAATGIGAVLLTGGDLTTSVIGGIAGFMAFEFIRRGYRLLRGHDGMGGGDPKLLGAIGLWTGWQALPFVVVGASVAGFALLAVRILRGKPVNAATRVPLGACMAVSAIIVWIVAAIAPFISLAAL